MTPVAEAAYPDALPALSRLHWYVVERVLGQGGFGITYLARDTNLDQPVAIKEYLPVDVAARMGDATIRSRSEELRDRYRWGLERFIQEARTLARFDHPNIVRVQSVFEFNNTAYMVMRFEKGMTLSAQLDRRGTLPERELLRILLPILDGLELIHNAGFIHRDVKPDNIHIGEDGNPVLLDFGSARQALGASHTLTILVAPGYAPFEQYYSDSSSQGPWTDIYGLGATCYRAIAGRPPLDAVSRSKGILGSTQEIMVPASVVGAGRYSGSLLAAIDHALAFAEKDRPPSIAAWRRELVARNVQPPAATELHNGSAVTSHAGGAAPAVPPTRAAASPAVNAPGAVVRSEPPPLLAPIHPRDTEAPVPAKQRKRAIALAVVIVIVAAGVGAYVINKLTALEKQLEQQAQQAKEQQKKEEPPKIQPPIHEEPKVAETSRPLPEEKAQIDNQKRPEPPAPKPTPKQDKSQRAEIKEKSKQPPASPAPPKAAPKEGSVPSSPAPSQEPKEAPAPNAPTPAPAPELPKSAPEAPKRATPDLRDADAPIKSKRDGDALAILKPLAENGNAQAQTCLGTMFASGTGVDRSPNLAYLCYGIAARLGSADAKVEQNKVAAALQPAERAQLDPQIEDAVRRMSKKP